MGFIPAGAGNRSRRHRRYPSPPVHPRWRGEQTINTRDHGQATGSSPLTRGTDSVLARLLKNPRFIPAGAGNSIAIPLAKKYPTVHPRWRGEQLTGILTALEPAGSSPLARGTAPGRLPARWPGPVHPRWRGEQLAYHFASFSHTGSSPLARGTESAPCLASAKTRFIPAGAGNSSHCRVKWRK